MHFFFLEALQKFFTDRFDWLPWFNSEKSEKPSTSLYPILYNYNPSLHYGDTPANYFSPLNAPVFAYSGPGTPQHIYWPQNVPWSQNFHSPLSAQHPSHSYLPPIVLVFGSKPSNSLENLVADIKPTSLVEGFSPQSTGQSGHVGQHPHQIPVISQTGQIVQTAVASQALSSVSSPIKGEDREQFKNEPEGLSAQIPVKGSENIEPSSYEDDKDIKIPFHYLYPLLAQTAVSQRNPIQKKLNDRMGLVYLRDLREGRKMS